MADNDQPIDWEIAEDSEPKAERRPDPAFVQDRCFYRIVGIALSTTATCSLLGGLVLAYFGKPIPEGIIAIGATAVGALAGVLVGNRR